MTGHAAFATGLCCSARERRLWAWTAAVVVGIYSTLGVARTFAGLLTDGSAAVFFVVAILLVATVAATRGLTVRPGKAEIAVAAGVAAVYLMVLVRMGISTERSHLIEYGVVALFIFEALHERRQRGRHVPLPALVAVVAASLIGMIDEGIQALLPSRVFDPRDIVFNVLAAMMAVAASVVLDRTRRRFAGNGW